MPYSKWDIDPSYWEPLYTRIANDLGLSKQRDTESTLLLHDVMKPHAREVERRVLALRHMIRNNTVAIFGCGPSLDRSLKRAGGLLAETRTATIAADGATSALLEQGITPDIISSDLDGYLPDIVTATQRGSIILLHGHGDNIPATSQYAHILSNIIPITQGEPTSVVRNFGGFTDGDKSVHLAGLMGASRLVLFGMDFGSVIGPRSDPLGLKNPSRKLKKLRIGATLASLAIDHFRLDVSSPTPSTIRGVKLLRLDELRSTIGG